MTPKGAVILLEESMSKSRMGNVAQMRSVDVWCGVHVSANRKEVERVLRDGCPVNVVAANYGMRTRDVRRIARRVGA